MSNVIKSFEFYPSERSEGSTDIKFFKIFKNKNKIHES